MNVKIEESWKAALAPEFEKPYFSALAQTLHAEKAAGYTIYPPGNLIFNAFEKTPLDSLKVVILGQDPYHNPGEAMGLSFSVPNGIKMPPSLRNIFKEIHDELGVEMSGNTDLTPWAEQGVLLLNAMLTVRAGSDGAASHKNLGWQQFTDAVIRYISDNCSGVVFLLWGNFARTKKVFIDTTKHYVLEAAHPSPLAGGAFFGCGHFKRTNEILLSLGRTPIDWKL